MSRVNKRMRALMLIVFSLSLVLSACSQAPTPTSSPQITVLVTQILTQIVYTATPEPTLTPIPTSTPTPMPTSTPTYDPYSAPVYYPLKDCVASRLYVGDTAVVSPGGGPNGIRYGKDMHYDTIIGYADPGMELSIVGGPWCSHGWIVWMVQTKNGIIGFTPEGNGNEYWLLPVR